MCVERQDVIIYSPLLLFKNDECKILFLFLSSGWRHCPLLSEAVRLDFDVFWQMCQTSWKWWWANWWKIIVCSLDCGCTRIRADGWVYYIRVWAPLFFFCLVHALFLKSSTSFWVKVNAGEWNRCVKCCSQKKFQWKLEKKKWKHKDKTWN